MKASVFDQQHFPTLSVQEGYTAYAATYDEVKAEGLMDYPLLPRDAQRGGLLNERGGRGGDDPP